MDYVSLLNFFITIGMSFLSQTQSKLPREVLSAVQSALEAISKHRDDSITKANLEALRG
jgi:hypothetical protein